MAETHSLRTAELEVFFRSDISIRYWKSVPWKEGLLAIAANSAGLDLKWCLLLLKGPEERIFLVLFLHLPLQRSQGTLGSLSPHLSLLKINESIM